MKILKVTSAFIVLFCISIVYSSCVDKVNSRPATTENTLEATGLNWISIENLEGEQKKDSKITIVDVYTDWCKWCKVMDEKTFNDAGMVEYLKDDYHLVKLNAEQKSAIEFNGKSYAFKGEGRRGYHELAYDLCNGKLSYPSLVVLDKNLKPIKVIKGFKDPAALKTILNSI